MHEEIESPSARPAEAWAREKGISAPEFAGVAAGERWGLGRELTETEFDAAVDRARAIVLR